MHKLHNSKLLPFIIATIWTVILSIILLQPENQPMIPTGVQPAPPSLKREIIFSSLHLLTFGLTALLWCFSVKPDKQSKILLAMLMILLITFGLVVEYLQSSIPGRTAQWWDMLANSIGIIGGIVLWLKLSSLNAKQFFQVFGWNS